MIIILGVLLAFFLIYIAGPFFEKRFRRGKLQSGRNDHEDLTFRKEEILDAIQDLEYDFKMKKISEPDYLRLKEELTREAVEVLKKLDSLGKPQSATSARVV